MSRLQDIIEEIRKLESQLVEEIQKKEEEFFYRIHGRKVYFEEETRKFHKTMATRVLAYIADASILNILTAPIIWSCLVPAVILDAMVTTYQNICFRIYGIPKVRRADYIVIDRHNLNYLNPIEKMNCIYCGYFNGLMAYVQEIGARTEQYWCPIKHARKMKAIHNRYHKFMEYGDGIDYHNNHEALRRDFTDLEDE